MMRIILSCLLLLFASSVFSATPLTYAQCKRNTDTWTVTKDIIISGVPTAVEKSFRLDVFDKTYDSLRFLSNKFSNNEFTGPCDIVYRDAVGVETVVYQCSGNPNTGDQACAALMPQMSPDGTKISFTVYWGNNNPILIRPNQYDFSPNADSGTSNAFTENGGWVNVCSTYAANGYQCATENDVLVTEFLAKWAQLYEYEIATDTVTEITPKVLGRFDVAPTYVSNTRLAFLTTREMGMAPSILWTNAVEYALGWATIDTDGRNFRHAAKHRLTREFEGTVTPSGDILFVLHRMSAGLPYICNNGTAGRSCTIYNVTAGWAMNEWGERFATFGQHSAGPVPDSLGIVYDSLRPVTFTVDSDTDAVTMWFADYYRGNNNSLGELVASIMLAKLKEGPNGSQVSNHADTFFPVNRWRATTFADAEDGTSNVDGLRTGIFLGRVGYPGTLPGGKLVLSYGEGGCSTVLLQEPFTAIGETWPAYVEFGSSWLRMSNYYDALEALTGDTIPACHIGLYEFTPDTISSPDSLVQLVKKTNYNLIGAKAAVSYATLYPGNTAPAQVTRPDKAHNDNRLPYGTPDAFFGSGSIRDRDTKPCNTADWDNLHNYHGCGTETANIADEDIVGIRFLRAKPNAANITQTRMNNHFGYDVEILGEIRIDNRDGEGAQIMEPSPHQANPDTSFLAKLPADTPLIIQGIDKNGLATSTDQTPFSLFPGSKFTCGGCHKHSDDARITFAQSHAATPGYTPFDLTGNTTSLLAGEVDGVQQYNVVGSRTVQYEYHTDIQPIFDARCISCHNTANKANVGNLDLSISNPSDQWQSTTTWYQLVRSGYSVINYPQLSRYIKLLSARESLLYWKAAGQRMDGRLDSDRPDDIDFGTAHTTSITAAELAILGRWIDMGASGGTDATNDRLPPVLVLNSVIDSGTGDTTDIVIGTHDSDVSTFSLCRITPPSGTCVDETPVSINADGITTINLASAISNDDIEFRATISDTAGNTTTEQFTVGHMAQFASNEAPPEPAVITVDAGSSASLFEGDTIYKRVKIIGGTSRTYSVDWGDGSQPSTGSISDNAKSFEINKMFADGYNTFTAVVTVNDGVAGSGNDSFGIVVANKGPYGTVTGPATANMYENVTLVPNITNTGSDTLSFYVVDWDDGTTNSQLTHQYKEAGSYTVNLSIMDEDGTHHIANHAITISDTAPPCEP